MIPSRPRRAGSRDRSSLSLLGLVILLFPLLVGFDPVRSRSAAVEEGNARMKASKPDEALSAYDRAVTELPADPAAHFNRGTALAALSRFDEAAEEFLHATEAKETPLKAAAFYNLGNAFFRKDKFKEAIEAYKRACTLDPKDERAKWNLEIALKKLREDEKKKEQDKDKKNDKDKQDDKKEKQDQKKDQKQDQKQDQKKDQNRPDDKDHDKPPGKENQPEENAAAEKEIDAVLDSLEKSPKDLEKQRARMRAVRRAPPTKDW
jgi:Ca-activated chloride channel homolog